jgi:uncharacterized protein YbaR (Trm112 family)
MISQELLDLLVCPENKSALTLVEASVIAKVNTAITAGRGS